MHVADEYETLFAIGPNADKNSNVLSSILAAMSFARKVDLDSMPEPL